MENYSCDNSGNRIPPDVNAADPVAVSGVKLTDGTIDGEHSTTVVGGARYAFTCIDKKGMTFGIAACHSTMANVLWVCPLRETIIIAIPLEITSLYYNGLENAVYGYLRRLA